MYNVDFIVNSGNNKGDQYRYVLAENNGVKVWGVNPSFLQPPSMYKDIIKMSIFAGEHSLDTSGATELRAVNRILEELRIIGESEEPATLTGLDREERIIRIPKDGYNYECLVKETDKSAEYRVNLTCYSMYKYGDYK